jgi:dynactin complex subunit
MQKLIKVDDEVRIGKQCGVVRYVGELAGCEGTWYGVELDHSVGTCDGSFMNRRYFTCKPKVRVCCVNVFNSQCFVSSVCARLVLVIYCFTLTHYTGSVE